MIDIVKTEKTQQFFINSCTLWRYIIPSFISAGMFAFHMVYQHDANHTNENNNGNSSIMVQKKDYITLLCHVLTPVISGLFCYYTGGISFGITCSISALVDEFFIENNVYAHHYFVSVGNSLLILYGFMGAFYPNANPRTRYTAIASTTIVTIATCKYLHYDILENAKTSIKTLVSEYTALTNLDNEYGTQNAKLYFATLLVLNAAKIYVHSKVFSSITRSFDLHILSVERFVTTDFALQNNPPQGHFDFHFKPTYYQQVITVIKMYFLVQILEYGIHAACKIPLGIVKNKMVIDISSSIKKNFYESPNALNIVSNPGLKTYVNNLDNYVKKSIDLLCTDMEAGVYAVYAGFWGLKALRKMPWIMFSFLATGSIFSNVKKFVDTKLALTLYDEQVENYKMSQNDMHDSLNLRVIMQRCGIQYSINRMGEYYDHYYIFETQITLLTAISSAWHTLEGVVNILLANSIIVRSLYMNYNAQHMIYPFSVTGVGIGAVCWENFITWAYSPRVNVFLNLERLNDFLLAVKDNAINDRENVKLNENIDSNVKNIVIEDFKLTLQGSNNVYRELVVQHKPISLKPGITLFTAPPGSGKTLTILQIMGVYEKMVSSSGSISFPQHIQKIIAPQVFYSPFNITLLELLVYPHQVTQNNEHYYRNAVTSVEEKIGIFSPSTFKAILDLKTENFVNILSGGEKSIMKLLNTFTEVVIRDDSDIAHTNRYLCIFDETLVNMQEKTILSVMYGMKELVREHDAIIVLVDHEAQQHENKYELKYGERFFDYTLKITGDHDLILIPSEPSNVM